MAKSAVHPGLATEAMRFYQKLYKIERLAKEEKMAPPARYMLRQEKSKPVWEEFTAWLEDKAPTALPQSPWGKAFK